MSISIIPHCVGPLDVNCYLVGCDTHHVCAVVDPGDSAQGILAKVAQQGWEVAVIVNTHTHADHTGANAKVKEATGAPLVMHTDDVALALDPAMKDMADYLGLQVSPAPDRTVVDGDTIPICDCASLTVLHTPGHTRGGVCLLVEDQLITGDTLFRLSVGRTDLAGGDAPTLMRSLKEKILPLDDAIVIHPGHGDSSTIGEERALNPFLRGLLST